MKVVFVSNYFNHHQAPFSEAMHKLTNGDYWFIATEEMSAERKNMGWGQEELPAYAIQAYKSGEEEKRAKCLINKADVVVFGLNGWKNFRLLQKRLRQKKLTFRYSERIYKNGIPWYRLPIQAIKLWLSGGRYDSMYLLCASAYTAQDYAKTGSYLGKTYQWGYFPETRHYDIERLMQKKRAAENQKQEQAEVSILWAGRLIPWKHPEAAIELAAALKEKGYRFQIKLIGNGEMEEQLHRMIQEKNLADCVTMPGAMTPGEVRTNMERAEIYLFTSDFNEGWGAVLNEAMNSGCAVVASHAIGAAPFLMQDGKNGLVYENGNQADLQAKVQRLLEDAEYRQELGKEAYKTIAQKWNADQAAKRLQELADELEHQAECKLPKDGPCSTATILKNNWYQEQFKGKSALNEEGKI